MNRLIDLYERSLTTTEWEKKNKPDEDLIWKAGVFTQCGAARSLATLFNLKEEPRVISTHTSKSVGLPVIAFRPSQHGPNHTADIIAVMRDNFYDLCCQVVSSREMELSLYDLYKPRTAENVEAEREKALAYHTKTSNYTPPDYGSEWRAKEEKYCKDLATPGNLEWYSNWSSGELLQGDSHIFTIHKGWYEGFPCGGEYESREYYREPSKDFSFLARGYAHVAHVFQLAFYAAQSDYYREENKQYKREREEREKSEGTKT